MRHLSRKSPKKMERIVERRKSRNSWSNSHTAPQNRREREGQRRRRVEDISTHSKSRTHTDRNDSHWHFNMPRILKRMSFVAFGRLA